MQMMMHCVDCYKTTVVEFNTMTEALTPTECPSCGSENLVAVAPCTICSKLCPINELLYGVCEDCAEAIDK